MLSVSIFFGWLDGYLYRNSEVAEEILEIGTDLDSVGIRSRAARNTYEVGG